MKIPLQLITIIVISLCLSGILGQTFIYNSQNDHYYTFNTSTTTITRTEAVTACSQITHPTHGIGYLATITTNQEFKFLIPNAFSQPTDVNKRKFWISGSNIAQDNLFVYDSGPEIGESMYMVYQDRSNYYSAFQFGEPNLLNTEHYVSTHYDPSKNIYHMNNLPDNGAVTNYLCEFSAKLPFVPAFSSSLGGAYLMVTSQFPVGWNFVNMTGQLIRPGGQTPSETKNFTITVLAPTLVFGFVPPGYGIYDVVFTDTLNRQQVTVKGYQYRAPWISLVYPPSQSTLVTIAGFNFGNISSAVKVYVGSSAQECTSPTIVVSDTVITCSYTLPIINFLPVTVSVGGVEYSSYKTPVYRDTSNSIYYGTNAINTFKYQQENAMNPIYGYTPRFSVVETQALYSWYSSMQPVLLQNNQYTQWEGMEYNDATSVFVSMYGGQVVPYRNTFTQIPWTFTSRYYLNWYDLSLHGVDYDGIIYAGLLLEYNCSLDPEIKISYGSMGTEGGPISVTLYNYQSPLSSSQYQFLYDGLPIEFDTSGLYNPDNWPTSYSVKVVVPPGVGGPHLITGTHSEIPLAGSVSITFSAPYISGIPNAPSATGLITISGESFGNDITMVSILVDNAECPNKAMVIPHKAISCEMGQGVPGSTKSVQVVVAEQPSNQYTVTYASPAIQQIIPPYSLPNGGNITIVGSNFYDNLSLVIVKKYDSAITVLNCQFLTLDTTLECSIPYGRGGYDITVEVTTYPNIISSLASASYYNPVVNAISQNGVVVDIVGQYFGYLVNGPHFVGFTSISHTNPTTDIMSYCVGLNDTVIRCTLPLTSTFAGNGTLSILISSGYNLLHPLSLNPYVTALSNTIFDTDTTQTIDISGLFFDNSNSLLVITNDGVADLSSDSTVVNSVQSITYKIPQDTGKDIELQVKIGNTRISNIMTYSYKPPVITSLASTLQNEIYQLTITGSQFGMQVSDVQALYVVNSRQLQVLSVNQHTAVVSVDPSFEYESHVLLNVSSQDVLSVSTVPLKPLFQSITNKAPVIGGTVTIIGSYMSINQTKIQLQSQSGSIVDLASVTKNTSTHWETIVAVPPGTGSFQLRIVLDNSIGDFYSTTYQSPIIRRSTELYFNQPGNVTITGDNFAQVTPVVTIGTIPCTNPFVLSTSILVCHFSANVTSENGESLDVSVTVDSLTGSNQVFFYTLDKDCEKNCSGHGDCDRTTSTCTCYTGFTGSDCSIKNNTKPEPPKTDGNGNTNLPGQSVNFNISLAFIREKKFDDSIVKVLDLTTMNIIEQKLVPPNISFFKGIFNNNNVSVQFNVTYYPTQTTIDFAGEPIQQPSNSIKYQISIFDWDFEEQTNHLELIYKSSTPSVSELNCEETKTNSTNNIDNYRGYKIQAGSDLFETKFSDRMIVDNRLLKSRISQLPESDPLYQQISNNQDSEQDELSILISLSTPYFRYYCTLDPNFSVLLTTESTNDNDCESKNKWKLPVIIVLTVVGGLSIIIAIIILIKKKIIFKRQMKIFLQKNIKISR
ncbi:EGF-like domain-containing protein [Tieghemostelium lacteum]|uniref:EGF-like domain-containing protein n=1 Tax=Tieghemostelium lacteum TaxID=361077 RepID=A0A152A846_TIELA|nr:EGF-like domain-containing protein [Tieghemostelium lacteum]|eukprot:KYR02378.1 EGF-like domain-containing protein [Tieghemostelium lacteum]